MELALQFHFKLNFVKKLEYYCDFSKKLNFPSRSGVGLSPLEPPLRQVMDFLPWVRGECQRGLKKEKWQGKN